MANIYATFIMLIMLVPATMQAQNYSIYVSDAGNYQNPPWQILKFDQNGQHGEVFISDHLAWPQDILFLEEDTVVLISNLNTGQILRFHANTGAFINVFAGSISGPTRMKIGSDGLLYVLQWVGDGKVKRYQLDGTFVDNFTETGVSSSIGLDWDSGGNLYVSSYEGFVQKFSPSGEDLGVFINTNLAGPTNIWFDDTGDLLVMDYNAAAVKRFDSIGNFEEVFISGVGFCEGIDFLPNGNILIGVGGTSSVRMYTPAGELISTVVQPGTLNLLTPNAVVLREESNTTGILNPKGFRDLTLLTPSVGSEFYFTHSALISPDAIAYVYNRSGVLVDTISFAGSTTWSPAALPNGIYIFTMRLTDHTTARQKVLVKH